MSPHNAKSMRPVLILGGSSNALAVTRSLARMGVDVYLSVLERNCAHFTRFARGVYPFADKNNVEQLWYDLLIADPPAHLEGCMVFPCNDDGIEFIAKHHAALAERYILDDAIPALQVKLLNKLETLKMAAALDIPTPRFLEVKSVADLTDNKLKAFEFPALVKPQQSHLFQKEFGGQKFFLVHNTDELMRRLDEVIARDLKVIISELIPGSDNQLRSYYTYIGRENEPLFHFTKAVLRRYPKNHGQGCYHYTVWDPEVAELGLRFFQGIGFRGLGNIEFKRDERDGKFKVIESNPRFTAAHELLVRCGMDVSRIIYCYLAGLPMPQINGFRENVTLFFPQRDWYAYRELQALGELGFGAWLKSVAKPHVLPHFCWHDPMPTIIPFFDSVKGRFGGSRKEKKASDTIAQDKISSGAVPIQETPREYSA